MSRVWLIGLLLVNVLLFALIRWGALLTDEPEALLAQTEFNAGSGCSMRQPCARAPRSLQRVPRRLSAWNVPRRSPPRCQLRV